MKSAGGPSLNSCLKSLDNHKTVDDVADSYLKYFDERRQDNAERLEPGAAAALTSSYYDIATDFFEWGWGESFHFGTINKGESREHAFARHEYRLALKLGLKKGDTVLDIGCGIGGPARHIAAFSQAKIIGLNINEYQISRARKLTQKAGMEKLCEFVQGDFCNIPLPDNSIQSVYAIEATCHASDDLSRVYGDVYRVLKPGGLFAFYEWAMTDKYDDTNAEHTQIKDDILIGDGLPDLVTTTDVRGCLKKVGFEILEAEDLVPTSTVPWYSTLEPNYWSIRDFKTTPLGRWLAYAMLNTMETLRLAPKGSCKVHRTLCKGADGLVLGGRLGIFTPMYLVVVRKPS